MCEGFAGTGGLNSDSLGLLVFLSPKNHGFIVNEGGRNCVSSTILVDVTFHYYQQLPGLG